MAWQMIRMIIIFAILLFGSEGIAQAANLTSSHSGSPLSFHKNDKYFSSMLENRA